MGTFGLVHYQSHGVHLQWMHFMAISLVEAEIGYGTKTPI
jgi:hypothetical protein